MREILSEVNPKTGRTELEQLLRQLLRRAHQGSMKSADSVLERAFGKAVAIQQNLNVNAEVNQGEMTLAEVDAKLTEHFNKLGVPKPIWAPGGPVLDIEAIDKRIEVLLEKKRQDEKPKTPPQLTEGTDSIQ